MHVTTDLLMWNDAHMQSRAKIHHVAVLTGIFVELKSPNVFLRFSSILVTKFGKSMTPRDNKFVMSSSSCDCNQCPYASTLGLWNTVRPDDDEARCSLFSTRR